MSEALRFETIVAPTDFSPAAERALELAAQLARQAGPAKILLVNAYAVPLELEALAIYGAKQVYEELAAESDKQMLQEVLRNKD